MSPGPVLAQGDERGSEHVRKAGSVHGDVAGSHPVDCLAVSMVFRGSFSIVFDFPTFGSFSNSTLIKWEF